MGSFECICGVVYSLQDNERTCKGKTLHDIKICFTGTMVINYYNYRYVIISVNFFFSIGGLYRWE